MGTNRSRLAYAEYLMLGQVLGAQRPRTEPEQQDEMLFIIFHQVTELWFKLLLHELTTAREQFRGDEPGLPSLARAQQILLHLNDQWLVLDTLTPAAFHRIRLSLGSASGLYSEQYRALEFLLGKRHPGWRKLVQRDAADPSLFDELIRYLHRRGHVVPERYLARDWTRGREITPELLCVFEQIYTSGHGIEYEICEELSSIDMQLREWRLRHLETVRRHLGARHGTGGTTGADYLAATSDAVFFPELVRSHSL